MPKGNPKGYAKAKKGGTSSHKGELASQGGSYGPQKPLGAVSMSRRIGKK